MHPHECAKCGAPLPDRDDRSGTAVVECRFCDGRAAVGPPRPHAGPKGEAKRRTPVFVMVGLFVVALVSLVGARIALDASPPDAPAVGAPPGSTAPGPLALAPDTPISVEWRGSWYDARVIEHRGDGYHLVHYEGWGPQFDEVVEPIRIRLRVSAP